MSINYQNFKAAMADVNDLRERIDRENRSTSGSAPEYLKRNALTMVTTAWETYVEDTFETLVKRVTGGKEGSLLTAFFAKKAGAELKMLHNPTKQKVQRLFVDYFDFDVTEKWTWANYQCPKEVGKKLDEWLALRGEIVHRSTSDGDGHSVSADELRKCVNFFEGLVGKTEEEFGSKFG